MLALGVPALPAGPLADDALWVALVHSSGGEPSSEGGGSEMSESLSKHTGITLSGAPSAPSGMALEGSGLRSLRKWVSSTERAIAFWRRAVSASADLVYFSFCSCFL